MVNDEICVVLTSCGGDPVPGMIECLRGVAEHSFRIVGVDASETEVSRTFPDSFHQVPRGEHPRYLDTIEHICKQEQADVIVPLSDGEARALSTARQRFRATGVDIVCCDSHSTRVSSDKGKLLTFLEEKKIEVPGFELAESLSELTEAAKCLGYPENKVVIKPRVARGGRGVYILDADATGPQGLFQQRGLRRLPLEALEAVCQPGAEECFPPVVVMDYLSGRDYNVDVLADNGEPVYIIPIERVVPDVGPVKTGRIVHSEPVRGAVEEIVDAFSFDSNVNIEMAYPDSSNGGKPLIYEINPRVSAPIAAHAEAGVNLLLFGILKAMGIDYPKNLEPKPLRMERCWRDVYSRDYGS